VENGYRYVHYIRVGYDEYVDAEGNTLTEGKAVYEPCNAIEKDNEDN
jgi:hypothetical protein